MANAAVRPDLLLAYLTLACVWYNRAMAKKTTLNELGGMMSYVVENMATKDDIKDMATKDDLKNFAKKDDLKNFATKDDLKNFATKDDVRAIVDGAKEEILAVVRPIERAVDKDAVTVVKHEKRITRIERQLIIK